MAYDDTLYDIVEKEARHDYPGEREPSDFPRRRKPWDGNPETAPDAPEDWDPDTRSSFLP